MSASHNSAPERAYLLLEWVQQPVQALRVDLLADLTCLGRPDPDEAGPQFIDLKLPQISRRHARIRREDGGYILENWEGRGKIRLYERSFGIGERHPLRHCDVFRIPDIDGPHVQATFVVGSGTRFLPFQLEPHRPLARVFGHEVQLAPREYRLLAYLYRHLGQVCRYDDLCRHIWDPDRTGQRQPDTPPRKLLEPLLSDIRAKIRRASGEPTFLETFPGEGVRLVI